MPTGDHILRKVDDDVQRQVWLIPAYACRCIAFTLIASARRPTGNGMRGLRWQLAWFYLVLAIPALLVVERAAFGWKFEYLLTQLDDGRVQRALEVELRQLLTAAQAGARDAELEQRLHALVLRLERPRESLQTRAAFVLLELAEHPFQVQFRLPGRGVWQVGGNDHRDAAVQRDWQVTAAVPLHDAEAELRLRLAVASPWQINLSVLSFEWTLAVAYLVLFLFGSAWFLRQRVLQRVARIGDAAQRWAAGDFSARLADASADELGRLADDLNRMALDLAALVETRAELATLSARQQVARDLHDTVKQKVFALSLQLEAARSAVSPQVAHQGVAEALSLVAEVQAELSEVLLELRSDADPWVDVVLPLQQRLQDFARRSECRVDSELVASLPLAAAQADALLRIVDEALANVWRHARATAVEVILSRRGVHVTLIVGDNGCGLTSVRQDGMGLSNMRDRARELPDGALQLASAEAGGTQVRLSFHCGSECGS
jgi:signal transduction histidine kinase